MGQGKRKLRRPAAFSELVFWSETHLQTNVFVHNHLPRYQEWPDKLSTPRAEPMFAMAAAAQITSSQFHSPAVCFKATKRSLVSQAPYFLSHASAIAIIRLAIRPRLVFRFELWFVRTNWPNRHTITHKYKNH